MQLIQIGQTPTKTVQQLIEEMAVRQSAEIEQLKQAALDRHAAAQFRRASKTRTRQARCERRSTHVAKRVLAL